MIRYLFPALALCLQTLSGLAAADSEMSGEFGARYWQADPTGDVTHEFGNADNDVDDELGLDSDGQLDLFGRLTFPSGVLDFNYTKLNFSGQTQKAGTFNTPYSAGESTEMTIQVYHLGYMFNPLRHFEGIDGGLGIGLNYMEGTAEVGSEDTHAATIFPMPTFEAELRSDFYGSPFMAALRYRQSKYHAVVSAEAGFSVASMLDLRAGYHYMGFGAEEFDGSVAGPFAGLSLTF